MTTDSATSSLLSTGSDKILVKTMKDLITSLNAVMGDEGLGDNLQTVRKVKQLMQSYTSHSQDWSHHAVYHEGTRYTRNLVDDGNGKYNLLILVWGENQSSPIHDHAGSHCMMKLLAGELDEDLFAWPKHGTEESGLKLKRTAPLKTNSVAYMHDNIGLHRIGNPSTKHKAVSLHLYSPPYDMCKTFNEKTGASAESSCSAERLTRLNGGSNSSAAHLHTQPITTVSARCQQQQQERQPESSITSFQLSI